MDKLNRSGSIIGRRNEDDVFIQDSIKDAFKGICSAFGIGQSDSFILTGCQISDNGTTLTVTPGYIALGGEICKVDAHSVAKLSPSDQAGFDNFWVISTTFDAGGLRPIDGGGSENTWWIRKGKLVLDDTGLNPDRFDQELPTIHELAANKSATFMKSELSKLGQIMPTITALNNWTISRQIIVKDALGLVHVSMMANGTNANDPKICDFPAGFKGLADAPSSISNKPVQLTLAELTAPIGSQLSINFSFIATG